MQTTANSSYPFRIVSGEGTLDRILARIILRTRITLAATQTGSDDV